MVCCPTGTQFVLTLGLARKGASVSVENNDWPVYDRMLCGVLRFRFGGFTYVWRNVMGFDWPVLWWIQRTFGSPVMDALMPKVTMLGNGGVIWIAIAVLLLSTRRYRRQGCILLAGLLIGFLVGNVVLKQVFARPRPCWVDPAFPLLVSVPSDYSFPSGHTLSSVIAATILMQTDWRLGCGAVVLAVVIAFSRLYLYVHYPSDVLGGAVLGIIIGLCVYREGTKVREKKV